MSKKATIAAIVLAAVMVFGALGCASSQSASSPASSTESSATQTEAVADASSVGATGAPLTLDQYFDLRARLDAASTVTEHYGDSDPHNSVHGSMFECSECHVNAAGGGEVKERFVCNSCHAWPRDLQSDMRDVTGTVQ